MTEYKLIEKTYKTERYVAPFMDKVDIVIMIWYHTTLKYWSVGVRFDYPPHYRTPYVMGKDYIETRKGARLLAESYMKIEPVEFFDLLTEFHKDEMLKSIKSIK